MRSLSRSLAVVAVAAGVGALLWWNTGSPGLFLPLSVAAAFFGVLVGGAQLALRGRDTLLVGAVAVSGVVLVLWAAGLAWLALNVR
jgi:hypothetical protein